MKLGSILTCTRKEFYINNSNTNLARESKPSDIFTYEIKIQNIAGAVNLISWYYQSPFFMLSKNFNL